MSQRAAFFDVDETLINCTSIFRFLAYDLMRSGHPRGMYEKALAGVLVLKAAGCSREDTNRAFYRLFTGRSVQELMVRGEQWFRAEHERGHLFKPHVLTMLCRHVLAGDRTVLVSGSFLPCLGPLARFVGAGTVMCTAPEIVAGRYTGEVLVPMVGANKAEAVRRFAQQHGIALEDCHGYGDDVSDVLMLKLLGRPFVVGDNEVLHQYVINEGWSTVPG